MRKGLCKDQIHGCNASIVETAATSNNWNAVLYFVRNSSNSEGVRGWLVYARSVCRIVVTDYPCIQRFFVVSLFKVCATFYRKNRFILNNNIN